MNLSGLEKDPNILFLHCRACVTAGKPQKLDVFVDHEQVLFVVCRNHKEPMLVASLNVSFVALHDPQPEAS